MWQHVSAFHYYVVIPWAAVSTGVKPVIASLTSGVGVVRFLSLKSSLGEGCEPWTLVGFRAYLVPKRVSDAGRGEPIPFWVSSRDLRHPSRLDAYRMSSNVRGPGRTR
jgi:hypothetical protein